MKDFGRDNINNQIQRTYGDIVKNLAEALKNIKDNQPSMTEFNFHYNPEMPRKSEFIKYFTYVLENNNTLRRLGIYGLPIGQNVCIYKKDCISLAIAIGSHRTLEELTFSSIREASWVEILLGELKCSTSLKSLTITGYIGLDGAKKLGEFLSSHSNLEFLSLARSQIGDEELGAVYEGLNNHPSLKQVVLSNNNITDRGAGIIADLLLQTPALKRVYLNNNKITDTGAMNIAKALRGNYTISEANLVGNYITPKACTILHDIELCHISLKVIAIEEQKPYALRKINEKPEGVHKVTSRKVNSFYEAGEETLEKQASTFRSLVSKHQTSIEGMSRSI